LSPRAVLFVFAWLVVGGEETELRLLARGLDPARYRIEVAACLRRKGMPDQTEQQLAELGIPVDRSPYRLSFEDTVEHLAERVVEFDLVVACQGVPDVVPALRLAASRGLGTPPLIEHGGLVSEAERASDLAARYIGVCETIRAAAAGRLVGREWDALEIPSMVDLDEFDPEDRAGVRDDWAVADDDVVFGWVGRLDRKKRVEDFVQAAALVSRAIPAARFVVIGGADAFMPGYAVELRELVDRLDLGRRLTFLGDRPDVARLMTGLDALVWLARGEGMPHVIAEAGAASLAVIATPDNGTLQQIDDERTGLFVPHERPALAAAAMIRVARDGRLRQRLGAALRSSVEDRYAASVVVPRWERLFDEVIEEHLARQG